MSGIINSTGARSGVIGTTVGTPPSSLPDYQIITSFYPAAWQLDNNTTATVRTRSWNYYNCSHQVDDSEHVYCTGIVPHNFIGIEDALCCHICDGSGTNTVQTAWLSGSSGEAHDTNGSTTFTSLFSSAFTSGDLLKNSIMGVGGAFNASADDIFTIAYLQTTGEQWTCLGTEIRWKVSIAI